LHVSHQARSVGPAEGALIGGLSVEGDRIGDLTAASAAAPVAADAEVDVNLGTRLKLGVGGGGVGGGGGGGGGRGGDAMGWGGVGVLCGAGRYVDFDTAAAERAERASGGLGDRPLGGQRALILLAMIFMCIVLGMPKFCKTAIISSDVSLGLKRAHNPAPSIAWSIKIF
jgi:hypothetical protein